MSFEDILAEIRGDFDDDAEAETPDVDLLADDAEAETPETAAEETPAEETVLTVKHKGAAVPLTRTAAEEAAQLGLFVKDNDALESVKWFVQQAKAGGFKTVEDYRKDLANTVNAQRVADVAAELNVSEDVAGEIVEARDAKRDKAEQPDTVDPDSLVDEIIGFNKAFPGVDVKTLPAEVLKDKADNKLSLSDAYLRYFYRTKQEEEKLAEAKREAQAQYPGKLSTPDIPQKKDFFSYIDARLNEI